MAPDYYFVQRQFGYNCLEWSKIKMRPHCVKGLHWRSPYLYFVLGLKVRSHQPYTTVLPDLKSALKTLNWIPDLTGPGLYGIRTTVEPDYFVHVKYCRLRCFKCDFFFRDKDSNLALVSIIFEISTPNLGNLDMLPTLTQKFRSPS